MSDTSKAPRPREDMARRVRGWSRYAGIRDYRGLLARIRERNPDIELTENAVYRWWEGINAPREDHREVLAAACDVPLQTFLFVEPPPPPAEPAGAA